MPESFLQASAFNFIKKETLAQLFSMEFLRTPFYRTLPDDCFCIWVRLHYRNFIASFGQTLNIISVPQPCSQGILSFCEEKMPYRRKGQRRYC